MTLRSPLSAWKSYETNTIIQKILWLLDNHRKIISIYSDFWYNLGINNFLTIFFVKFKVITKNIAAFALSLSPSDTVNTDILIWLYLCWSIVKVQQWFYQLTLTIFRMVLNKFVTICHFLKVNCHYICVTRNMMRQHKFYYLDQRFW